MLVPRSIQILFIFLSVPYMYRICTISVPYLCRICTVSVLCWLLFESHLLNYRWTSKEMNKATINSLSVIQPQHHRSHFLFKGFYLMHINQLEIQYERLSSDQSV